MVAKKDSKKMNSSKKQKNYVKYAKDNFQTWKSNHNEYERKVKDIIRIFGLKKDSKFNTKLSPKYWTGNIDIKKPKVIIVSLNPGKSHNPSRKKEKDWKEFKERRENGMLSDGFQKSAYWLRIYKLVCGLDCKIPQEPMDGKYVLKNVLNLNLFPYHSKKSEYFPSKFDTEQLEIVLEHMKYLFRLIEKKNPQYCIFNGKVWETLLIKHQLSDVKFSKLNTIRKNSRGATLDIYHGKKKGTRYVVFNKFISRTNYYGITDKDLVKKIPKKIKKQF